ncbi:MAG: efflux RND transporter periplasmic adaptor subunit [Bacteroidales bacterium]|nr:efflux RND transporter periplasmic adaptor subunit [Bacteroidales bacterium]
MKKILVNTVFAIIAMSMVGCGNKSENSETGTTDSVSTTELVKVTVMEETSIAKSLDLTTTLEGYETMNIAPSVTGNIEKIHVEVGSKVVRGQSLVTMDQQQYINAKLTMSNLETEMKRVQALKETGNVTQQVYDQTKLGYDQAKQALEFLTKNTFVKADFAGVISAKNYENGEMYAGAPILVLTQIKTLKAFVNVPETYFSMVKEGMKVDVISDIYPDKTFEGVVEIIYPTLDATTHTFKVKIKIPNDDEVLRPGMYSHTKLALGEMNAIVVPYQAVLKLQGSNDRYVFVNENGVAKRVAVELGQRFDDKIEVISTELSKGMQLITTGQSRLNDGVAIEIAE